MAIKVAVFHQNFMISDGLIESLDFRGFEAIALRKFSELVKQEARGKPIECEVAIIHKDFSAFGLIKNKLSGYKAEQIIEKIIPPEARRVIVAGEYPHAKNRVIKDFKADHYWDIASTLGDGFFECIKYGMITPREAELRGVSVPLEGGGRVTVDPELTYPDNRDHSRDDYFKRDFERNKEK